MFKKEILDNGIRVVTERIPHVRSVSLGVWVNVGARDEGPEVNGVSHFIEHMLFKGTRKRSARDIAIEMDSMGGELNAFTSKEGTTYYLKVLDEHLPRAVDLLRDIFNNSVFDPKELDKERKVIVEEIKMVEDTPDDLVHELLYEEVWRGSALGQPVLGRKRTIGSLKRDDLMGFMRGNYVPSEIVISAAGNFEDARLMDMLDSSFGGLRRKAAKKPEDKAGFKRAVKVRHKKLEQVHICMGAKGFQYGYRDRFGVYVLNTLLGSSMSSRLFQEIREKRGLAYSVYSYITSLRDTGLFVIYAGVSPQNAAPAVKVILHEIRKLKKGVSEDELRKVKEQLKGNMVLAMENTYNRMSQLAKHEIYLGRHYTIDEILAQIEAVDEALVLGTVDTIFREGSMAVAALGPVKKEDFKDSLARL